MRCSTIAAITLPVVLGACASDPRREPLSRDIGPPPAYLQPVAEPPAHRGGSPLVDARRLVGALREANTIITCARQDWRQTRDRMMGVAAGAHERKGEGCANPFPAPIK